MSSRKRVSSDTLPVNRLTSKSQQQSQSRQNQRPRRPVCKWSVHATPSGPLPSPFPRRFHALSTTATTAGEWFFFGGYAHGLESNGLYMFSTRDFSTTHLQTSGDVPSPRAGPAAVLTGTTLLIWGGKTDSRNENVLDELDDSLYLLNLVSRKWTRVLVDGPKPVGRHGHTVTMVGSKFFIFGGYVNGKCVNDIWAFDLNSLNSKPAWESYEPAPEDAKPIPRDCHVSVTTGDRIIVFGGNDDVGYCNDTWSFEISTRKWTELQCTGSIPSPRAAHAAVLIDDDMYVFGGFDGSYLGDLTAFNLSTQRWFLFQYMGPRPCRRYGHTIASDGTRIFVLGGRSSESEGADETLIHVVDTSTFGQPPSFNTGHIECPKPDPNSVKPCGKTTQLVRKSSKGPLAQEQPQRPTSSSSDAHAIHGPSEGEVTQLEHERIVELERQLSSALEQAEAMASAVEDAKRVGLEQGDQVLVQTSRVKQKDAELVSLQAKLDELLLSRTQDARALEHAQSALQKAKADADERSQRACERIGQHEMELAEVRAELQKATSRASEADERSQLARTQIGQYETELAEVRAKLQAKSDLGKATSRTAEADQRSQREQIEQYEKELAEVRTELEVKKSELETVRLRLTDAENGCAKSKAEAGTLHVPTAKSSNNTEESQITRRLLERMQAMEAEIASLRWNEKSFEMMECRNEG